MKQKQLFILLFMLIVGVLVSCGKSPADMGTYPMSITQTDPDIINTANPTTAMPVVTKAPTRTRTPANTIAPTATQTNRSTLSATATQISLLSADEVTLHLVRYYEDNGGCELPCWWGITPGRTLSEDMRNVLASLGQELGPFTKSGIPRYDYEITVPEVIDPVKNSIEPSIWVEDGVVKIISISSSWIEDDFDYSLDSLLEYYDQPDEIWIKLITDTQYEPRYEVNLFYRKKGIVFNSTGIVQTHEGKLNICPQKFQRGDFPPAVMLFSPLDQYTYEMLGQVTNRIDVEKFRLLRDIAIDFDEGDFYDRYLDPKNLTCIPLNSEKIN